MHTQGPGNLGRLMSSLMSWRACAICSDERVGGATDARWLDIFRAFKRTAELHIDSSEEVVNFP